MSHRIDELAMRRRALLLRSERLRADLAVDQRAMHDALSGVERFVATARRAAPSFLAVAGGLLLFRLLRRSRRVTGGAQRPHQRSLLVKALFWVSMARRLMPYAPLIREVWRSRSSRRSRVPALPEQ